MGKVSFGHFGYVFKIVSIFLIFIAFSFVFGAVHSENEVFAADNSAYICMRADTLEIFDEYNSRERLPMASTTKTMTALLVIENCGLDECVTVSEESVGVEGSSVYLKVGDKYSVKELLFGLMLRSGNDAATALAIHTAGSVEAFVNMMNFRAQTLGLYDTSFVNPHGLHDDNHYTTAYDLCRLGCFAIQNDIFREIVSTKSISVGEGESRKLWKNKNKILTLYDGGNGIKTGYTKKSGRCLVSSAERNGITVVAVVLNRGDMFGECINMMDRAFAKIN